MIKKVFTFLFALNLSIVPFVHAQNQQGSSSSSASSGAGAGSAAGAATAGVTAGVIGTVAAVLAVAAAISSSKADPIYSYSSTDGSVTTFTICIANC